MKSGVGTSPSIFHPSSIHLKGTKQLTPSDYQYKFTNVRTPDLIMEIQGLKKIARKLTLTLAP
jgi:hypothetical protein